MHLGTGGGFKFLNSKRFKVHEDKKWRTSDKKIPTTVAAEHTQHNHNAASYILECKVKVKVKCNLVQALRLCTGRTAHRGSRGIALQFLDHGTRRGWGVSVTPQPLFTPGKDPVPNVQETGWAPGQSGQVRKISPPRGLDPRTIQPAASRYTDYATWPTFWSVTLLYWVSSYWCLKGCNALMLRVKAVHRA